MAVKLVFSVNSPYFNVFHVIREFIEIATQVVQAYWYSIYMSYSSINHMLVAVIALNCWSTPAIYRLMKMHEAQNDRERLLSRVLCLLANAILNGFSSIVLPMALLVPLWKDFNFETFDVPTAYTYIDVYFAREVKGLQIIGTGTFGGLLVKLVPHVSILTCLFMVVHTVGRAPIERVSSSRANAITPSRLTAADFATVVMQAQVRQTFSSVHLVIEAVFIATGIAVLAIHITTNGAASRFPFDPHCDLVIAPWFATKYPCFVYTYDCEYFNSTTAHEGDLAFLDETALSTLNFAHCDELVVPSDIRRFTSLIGMNFTYLTLVDWPREAAVVQQYFPNMVFIAFSHVNLTTIPVGVLGPLPDLLQDMEFTRTNLSVIPNDLYEHWPDVGTLFIEFSHVKEIPESLLRINLYDLSLIGNKIENASVLEGLPSGISRVSLDHNPLRVLPAELQASEAVIVDFSAEHTMLTDVPVALVSNIVHLYLQDTAICQNARSEWQALEQVVCDRSYFRSDGKCLLD
ncbi:TPA: LOW QUALITY PROTEIN: hypothetical protein N0F65_004765 [Lagenidium giganteum]|uniref:Leucine-rich repeat domain, L domain-like n=1 Tax=Lagenidium giganteum TaxID=4803 RepID=A0AAV2YTX1_9STRA|nr:TPA: LOW QUALITY PROTEIN: hypothetical protein N0F65_004765 [Lagenidium giganteum]